MNDNKNNIRVYHKNKLIGEAKSITVDTETDKSPHLLPDYSYIETRVMADLFKGLKPGEVKYFPAKTGKGNSNYPQLNLKYSVDSKTDTVYNKGKDIKEE